MLFCFMNKALLSVHLHSSHNQTGLKLVQTENFLHRFQFQRMENRIHHQRRVSFTQSPKHHDDAIRDYELVTSVAAAAFAIHSLEETELRNLQKMREASKSSSTQSMRRKEDNISRPSYGEVSIKRSFGQGPRRTESAFPVRRPSGISSARPVSPIHHKNVETRPETCEKAVIQKIQKWYEEIKSKILSRECVKKNQAKIQGGRKKRALEHRRAMEMQNYRNRIARADMKAQLEDKRRKQESEVREEAIKIRKTDKVPVKCSCFNS